MEQKEYINQLYKQYLNDIIAPEEKDELYRYFGIAREEDLLELVEAFLNHGAVPEDLSYLNKHSPEQFQRLKDRIVSAEEYPEGSLNREEDRECLIVAEDELYLESPVKGKVRKFSPQRIMAIAAAILIAFSISFYFSKQSTLEENRNADLIAAAMDIKPGGNHATLILADGNTIDLSDDQSGIIIGTDSISYTDGSTLGTLSSSTFVIQSDSERSLPTRQASMLTLSTPNGGQYQVTLPDGTKVWLNAASTLKYPSRFDGKDRRVELEGEAYFEVSQVSGNRHEVSGKKSNAKLPFIVISAGQEVTVLGTHFNISAYTNEPNIKTTLLEGSVQVSAFSPASLSSRGTKDPYKPSIETSNSTILTPGQQSIITGENITVSTANLEKTIAWKKGYFRFTGETIESIMQQLSRWYDIEVDYEGIRTKERFTGTVSKDKNISEVLLMLQQTKGVHFKIEGRRVIVMP